MLPIFLTTRAAFAYQHRVCPIKWSGYNLSRSLRQTGERPERIQEMRAILGAPGMGDTPRRPFAKPRSTPETRAARRTFAAAMATR